MRPFAGLGRLTAGRSPRILRQPSVHATGEATIRYVRKKTQQEYDAVVVGSGAGGAMAAYVLAMEGMKVLLLEAGRWYDPVVETPMFDLPREAPLRGGGTPDKPFGFYDATVDGGWQVPGEPYASADGADFMWWRARMLGGRTNHWGRISLRMGPYDFKPRSRDGLGWDWPMSYEDLAPWYDRTEALIGVYGSREGLENTPDSSEGILQPPPAPRAYELLTQKVCRDLGIPVVPAHLAILTQRQEADRLSRFLWPDNPTAQRLTRESMASRAACFWATPCGRGCSIKANFQTTTVLLPPALASGNLDIVTGAMVREVIVDGNGRAAGVHYVDKTTRLDERADASIVVLAASACESARILLNSRPALFPDGVANGSGTVGRYVMDTVGAGVSGQIPALENLPRHNEDGASAMHLYMPWWLYGEQLRGELDFARGYHIEFGGGQRMPGAGAFGGIEPLTGGSYGQQFKEDCRRYYGSFLYMDGRGEMIPNGELLSGDRPGSGGPVGDPDRAVPLGLVRARDQPGRPHASHVRGHHRGHGRAGVVHCARGRRIARHPASRADHPRGGRRPHGRGSVHVGAERILPVLGGAEPVLYGRRTVRVQRGQEPHPVHHGRRLALVRLARGRLPTRRSRMTPPGHPHVPDEVRRSLPEPRPLIDWAPATSDGPVPEPDGGGDGDPAGAPDGTGVVSRRVALKVLATAAAVPAAACAPDDTRPGSEGAEGLPSVDLPESNPLATGSPTDPDLLSPTRPWEPVLNQEEMATVRALADLILPADDRSPAASAVGAHDYVNEYVSAPYPAQQRDLVLVRGGLTWLDAESERRHQARFHTLNPEQQRGICDPISHLPDAAPGLRAQARFFDLVRDLVSTAFWTTDEGMADLGYVGNRASLEFAGPPREVLERLDLV